MTKCRRHLGAILLSMLLVIFFAFSCLPRQIHFEATEIPPEMPQQVEKPYYRLLEKADKIVIVVHRGEKNTGGYSVEVKKVEEIIPGRIHITIKFTDPSPEDIIIQVVTYPATAIAIEKNDLLLPNPRFIFLDQEGNKLDEARIYKQGGDTSAIIIQWQCLYNGITG